MAKPKIIVVLGPTAVGKSSLAVTLAKKFKGEIISADSRQIYKGLDIGTGKIKKSEMKGIPHYMLDVAKPQKIYTASDYKKDAQKAIGKIYEKNKTPIICGGTGFYIDTLIYDTSLPSVPPNTKLRKKLSKKSVEKLTEILRKIDPERALNIDVKNPRRLIRAIEIAEALGKVPKIKKREKYDTLLIGLDMSDEKLKEKITIRLLERLPAGKAGIREGMIGEAKKLRKQGLSLKRMEELGLEYRFLAKFLKGEMTKEEMTEKLKTEIWKYAKRQRTWFKRNKKIIWFESGKKGLIKEVSNTLEKFLKKV